MRGSDFPTGNSKDALSSVEMVESWNREEFSIIGHISALDIANYENDSVETIERIPLEGCTKAMRGESSAA